MNQKEPYEKVWGHLREADFRNQENGADTQPQMMYDIMLSAGWDPVEFLEEWIARLRVGLR